MTDNRYPYNTRQWQRLRDAKRQANPLCEPCEAKGLTVPMRIADHTVAIRNGGPIFPALTGLTSMCQTCHNRKTRDDVHGVKGYDLDGNPLDPETGWMGGYDNHGKALPADRCPKSNTDLVSKTDSGDDLWV